VQTKKTKQVKKPQFMTEVREHTYTEYESHPYWRLVDKGISDLVGNQDLVELAARPYIVGYFCKVLLSEGRTSRVGESKLNALSQEFDALLARMQTPMARAGMKTAFGASPKQLGKAATAVARKRR